MSHYSKEDVLKFVRGERQLSLSDFSLPIFWVSLRTLQFLRAS